MKDWSQPKEIDPLAAAFGCGTMDIGKYLPPVSDIPDEFRRGSNYWCQLVSKLFFDGGQLPDTKPGIDRSAALLHFRAVLGSFAPKHEHKEAGCAYLLSLWCDPPAESKPRKVNKKRKAKK